MAKITTTHYRWMFWGFFAFISYKFLAPSSHSGINIPHLDKVVHAGIFFVLTAFLHHAYTLSRKTQYILMGIYGLVIEILQAQTGYRSGDVFDWIADMFGVFMLFVSLDIWHKYQTSRGNINA